MGWFGRIKSTGGNAASGGAPGGGALGGGALSPAPDVVLIVLEPVPEVLEGWVLLVESLNDLAARLDRHLGPAQDISHCQPSAARAVTRDAWTLASVCHSSTGGAGPTSGLLDCVGGPTEVSGEGTVLACDWMAPATSYPSAARWRRAVWEMKSERGMPVADSNAWMTGNQVLSTRTACLRTVSGATPSSRVATAPRVSS